MRPVAICIAIAFLGAAFYGRADTPLQFIASGVAGGLYLYALIGFIVTRITEQARERAEVEGSQWRYIEPDDQSA